MNVNKILVPIDYSDHSTLALQWGISLAQKYGAHVLLLHVIPRRWRKCRPRSPERLCMPIPPLMRG